MERLWSRADATGGNRRQGDSLQLTLKQANPQPLAAARNRPGLDGKEHVCDRLPTIPFLLERESTSWPCKEIESCERLAGTRFEI